MGDIDRLTRSQMLVAFHLPRMGTQDEPHPPDPQEDKQERGVLTRAHASNAAR